MHEKLRVPFLIAGHIDVPAKETTQIFDVIAPEFNRAEKLTIDLRAKNKSYSASFTILSPADAQGYPNGIQSTEWQPGKKLHPFSPKYPGLGIR